MKSRLPKQIYFLIGVAVLLGILLRQVNQQVPPSESEKIQNAINEATLVAGIPSIPNLSGWPKEIFTELKREHTALSEPSGRIDALGALGEIYFANGFFGEAIQCFSALVAIEPEVPRWPYFLGLASRDYQDKSAAIRSFERALQLDESYPNIRYELGLALIDSGHILDSIEQFDILAKTNGWESWAEYGIARGLALEERYEAAIESIERAIEREPDVREFYSFAEELILQEGDRNKVELVEAIKNELPYDKRPFDPWVQALWGSCYDTFRLVRLAEAEALAGNRDRGLKVLRKAQSISGAIDYDPVEFESVEELLNTLN